MNHNDLIKQANDMINFCSDNRSCKDCPANKDIREFNGNLCDYSGYADNECQMTVAGVLEAVKNRKENE